MVRKHGWQLPAHTFQVIAITVFFILIVAFYAFFAPFLGKQILEYVAISVYTPVAIAVFILYVRSTRINPADPGIMSRFHGETINGVRNEPIDRAVDLVIENVRNREARSQTPSSTVRSPPDGNVVGHASFGGDPEVNMSAVPATKRSSRCFNLGGFFLFAKEDCRNDEIYDQLGSDDALFCTLCNAEVLQT
ncbi:putative S-acyltransferase [Platanthera zijinensis]|uniref:S-acyltransferase n=1 Tax=Platanthera zijinensis TaxID=2320716 RepID=A0AAP0BIE3_9ASPA